MGMTIGRAIKIKTTPKGFTDEQKKEADQLSIEAMKRVRDNPIVVEHYMRALLPGESWKKHHKED